MFPSPQPENDRSAVPEPGTTLPPVYYVDGSVAAVVIARMPSSFRRLPLPRAGWERAAFGERGVLLLDADAEMLLRAARLRDRVAIVAVAGPGAPATLPLDLLDGCIPSNAAVSVVSQTIGIAFRALARRVELAEARHQILRLTGEFQHLNDIGIKLSAESDTETLLDLILFKAREITHSDAGSLYLVEGTAEAPELRFCLVQNDSFPVRFAGASLPMTPGSVAGYVALTGASLNLTDAYAPPPGSPFQVDRTYDQEAGYRSKSMLVVPMKTPKDEVIGVLQLINCKVDPGHRFASRDDIERDVVPFPERFRDLASSLASQAAVALEKSRLYHRLRTALDDLEASHHQIAQTERLRALGELAGGIAHDFNNVLAIILGRSELLLEQVRDPKLRQQVQVIHDAAADGAQTVGRVQEFTRIRRARPFEPVDLNEVVRSVVDLTRSRWRDEANAKGVSYDVQVVTADVAPVAGDPAELREVLTNLLLNALDAMPRGGRITVATGLDAGRAWLRVTDTGSGMTEEIRGRVFEPFFTTKVQKGSGLGLSVTWAIVARHGATIDVRSAPGQGSTFSITFPEGPELAARAEPEVVQTAPRPLRILVIDDEPEVRQILLDFLTPRGHSTLACADGQAGLERFRQGGFDLVITDLGMPGLSGWGVAEAIKRESPRTPVALITGWGDQLDPEDAKARGVDFVVTKPFRLEHVLAVLSRASARR